MGMTLSLSRLCDCPSVCLSLFLSVCPYVPLFLQCRQLSSQRVIPTASVLCRHEHAVCVGCTGAGMSHFPFWSFALQRRTTKWRQHKERRQFTCPSHFFLVHSSCLKSSTHRNAAIPLMRKKLPTCLVARERTQCRCKQQKHISLNFLQSSEASFHPLSTGR